jgi:uncharacterized protein (DUF2249 family)/TusA-related sulfurtransferase
VKINAQTKISALLKQHPGALEAIVSLSPHFEKLRNPILRKLMAGRATIAMASKIGNCTEDDFFQKLKPLGFELNTYNMTNTNTNQDFPDFLKNPGKGDITELDVRPILASGSDPLQHILEKVKALPPGNILKIINTFEPIPLIRLLEKKGFQSAVVSKEDSLIETYFFKKEEVADSTVNLEKTPDDWNAITNRFADKFQTVDVRDMEMPLPMITILDALQKLPADMALWVNHKRIPVFLLPELAERNFNYCIKEISDTEVNLIIFRK